MSGLLLAIVLAVVLWALISLVIVTVWSQKQNQESIRIKTYEQEKQHDADEESLALEYSAAEEQEDTDSFMLPPSVSLSWKEQVKELPGLLGWVLLDVEGETEEYSDSEFSKMVPTLVSMLKSIVPDTEILGIHPVQLMEWEGPQGSILAAFPKNPEGTRRLVLFLGTEAYKDNMRERISLLNWETSERGDHVR